MSELNIDEIRSATPEIADIDEEILKYLNLENSMNARNSYGGTSTVQTKMQIEYFEKWLKNSNK